MTDLVHGAARVFEESYGVRPTAAATAPGRVEILGNHTDYNGGLVMSAAIFENSPARDTLPEAAQRLVAIQEEYPLTMKITPELQPWAAACERGYQCLRFKNWVGAQAAYEEALNFRVSDAFVHQALGFSFLELGEIENAVHALLRAVELDPQCDFTRLVRVQRTM